MCSARRVVTLWVDHADRVKSAAATKWCSESAVYVQAARAEAAVYSVVVTLR